MNIDIGLNKPDRKKTADGLSKVLADTYTLYLQTHFFHWNVTGPQFRTLHLMFEEQYLELAIAVDVIAERIRQLGFPSPGTYKQFQKLTVIKEDDKIPAASDMIRVLMENNEVVARTSREVFDIADEANDQATADLVTQRMQTHEKAAWMLRSMLE